MGRITTVLVLGGTSWLGGEIAKAAVVVAGFSGAKVEP